MSEVARTIPGDRLAFFCPGCKHEHVVTIGPGGWTWNGDKERPTFSPSVLIRSGHYLPGRPEGSSCWCKYNDEHPESPAPFTCNVCHSFVRGGQIRFLSDCTHDLAGQTVALPVATEP